jgi:hypothetical protein
MSTKTQLQINDAFQNNVSVVLSIVNNLLDSFYCECTFLS